MVDNDNLKQKSFNGVIWSYINTFGLQVLQLIPGMVLARLLTPSEYGIIAMASILNGLFAIFIDSGFSMALIQRKELKHIDICSVFYFNILSSIVVYVLLFICAPFVADFFHLPEVCLIMRITSLSMIIGSCGAVHNTLLGKELVIKQTTIRNLIICIVTAIISVSLAYLGFGYWALVFQGLAGTFLRTISNWMISKWRPTLEFSYQSLKSLFGFGSKSFAGSLTSYGFSKLYDVVIGKFYTPADLSYFNRANATQSLFTDTFLMTMNSVAFASFSKMQDDYDRMRINILRFFRIEVMIISFIMLLVIVLAEPIFHFMYSSRWDDVIPMFQIICVWGLFRPISCIFANGLLAHGDSGVHLKCMFIGRSMNILFLLITWKFGVIVMISGQVIAYLIEIITYSFFFNKVFTYSFWSMVKDIAPYYSLSAFLCLIIWGFDHYVMSNIFSVISIEMLDALLRLLVCGLGGLIVFVMLHRILRFDAYVDFKDIVIEATKSKPVVCKIAKNVL